MVDPLKESTIGSVAVFDSYRFSLFLLLWQLWKPAGRNYNKNNNKKSRCDLGSRCLASAFRLPVLQPVQHSMSRPYQPIQTWCRNCTLYIHCARRLDTDTSGSPFLAYVSNLQDFDTQLSNYVKGDYVKLKYAHTQSLLMRDGTNISFIRYQQLLGCSDVDLSNTTSLYARYTTSVICNGIVQSSKGPCGLSDDHSRPLCADTCVSLTPSPTLIDKGMLTLCRHWQPPVRR